MLHLAVATAGLLLTAPLAPRVSLGARAAPLSALSMRESDDGGEDSTYSDYIKSRGAVDMDAAEAVYRQSISIDQALEDELDGGDSGSGAVGDGNVDLEDQHNSATLGALRGGISDVTEATLSVGRGSVRTLDGLNPDQDDQEDTTVKGATTARMASAGKNYFGRSTGLADKLIDEMTDKQVKSNRMDKVRAQQKENWYNQRAIHESNRAAGQGVVFGEEQKIAPRSGGYIARDALSSKAWRRGDKESEISQRDLAKHMEEMAGEEAARLDGEEWGELNADGAELTETFSVRSSPRQTSVTDIPVTNDVNTFAPFRCGLLPGAHASFTVTPNFGTMNRRSGEPTGVVVRYTPIATGDIAEATLVFETEDMKKVYKFIGST